MGDHNFTSEKHDTSQRYGTGTPSNADDEFTFQMFSIVLAVVGWFIFYGNSRRKKLTFVFPPRPLWEVILSISYNIITQGLAAGFFPVLSAFAIFFLAECTSDPVQSTSPDNEPRVTEKLPPSSRAITFPSNFQVYITTYVICCGIISVLAMIIEMRNLYLVQRRKFKIAVDPLQVSFVPTMGDALCSSEFQIRQSAFYDLMILVDAREPRIFEFLKLTHPGRHPFAWNTVLTPITSLIGGATLYFNDFTALIKKAAHPGESEHSNEKLNIEPSSVTSFVSEPGTGKAKYFSRLRDLVSPIHTLVTLRATNAQAYMIESTSPVTKLIMAPSLILGSIVSSFQNRLKLIPTRFYPSILGFISLDPLTLKLRDTLKEQNILIWAIHILVGMSDFSISNDLDGVISTTLVRIIPVQIEFYETLEKLVEEIRPIRHRIRKKELERLVNLLTEYKKSLVFFYVNYASHARILRIPTYTVQRWRRICCEDINSHIRTNAGSKVDVPTLFAEEDY